MYSPVQGGKYRYYDHLKQKKAGELINISVGLLLSEMVVPVIPDILKILVGFRCEFNSFHQQVPDPFAQTFQRQFFFASISCSGNDSNLLIVFYVQIMPDDLVMQLHRF
ncbi:hypothetical protein CF57_25810 [Escherichia coli]|nr:hypothetical protein BU34_09405 [Escherichia coli]AHM36211.1 hypothetical protein CF57_25810 [Escherichia coli]AHM40740.1 hypothetical protein CF61_26030 [Escherichia coli]